MWCLTRGIGLVLAALTPVLSSDASAQTESKLLQGRASVLFTFVPVVQSGANSISVGEPSIDSLLQKFGVQDMRAVFARPGDPKHLAVYQRLGMDRVFEIRFDSMNTVTSVVEEFALNQLVEFVEAVGIVDAYDISPGDENFADQWYHSQPNDVDLDSPGAWAFDTTMILTKIAVIDAGIDSLHPELRPNLWKNQGEFIGNPPLPTQDGLDNDGNGYVDDIFGWDTGELDGDPVPGYRRLGQDCSRIDWFHAHGSRIVGPLMSVDNNFLDIIDQNIVGVIWHGSIINVKCLSDAGAASANTLAAGIQYAADAGAEIASISRGYIGSIGTLGMAVNYADALGVVMVAAVSYDTSAEGYPAGDIP